MDRAGERLRRARERLKLTYRDVAQASRELAERRGSPEFLLPLSRLADIENGGKVPSLFRLYSLCAIYRLDLHDVLRWYGVPVEQLASEALLIGLDETHVVQIKPGDQLTIPMPPSGEIDLNKTTFLSHLVRQWGKAPLSFLNGLDLRQHRYGLIGLEDWSMFPILRPGSLVLIDESRRRIARSGWTTEFDRPIYFLEHREGFVCGWCTLHEDHLTVQPHPASEKQPSVFHLPGEIEVIGQVTGVAMLLESNKRRHTRVSPASNKSSAPVER